MTHTLLSISIHAGMNTWLTIVSSGCITAKIYERPLRFVRIQESLDPIRRASSERNPGALRYEICFTHSTTTKQHEELNASINWNTWLVNRKMTKYLLNVGCSRNCKNVFRFKTSRKRVFVRLNSYFACNIIKPWGELSSGLKPRLPLIYLTWVIHHDDDKVCLFAAAQTLVPKRRARKANNGKRV